MRTADRSVRPGSLPLAAGDVTWDPRYRLDFAVTAALACVVTDPASGVLGGCGLVSAINGTPPALFCPGGQLTFVFGGFTPVSTDGTATLYAAGTVDFFTHVGPSSIDPSDPLTLNDAGAAPRTLWLSLAGWPVAGATLRGTVHAAYPPNVCCQGQLQVTGGAAASCFATGAQAGGADFAFAVACTQALPAEPDRVYGTANFLGATAPSVTPWFSAPLRRG